MHTQYVKLRMTGKLFTRELDMRIATVLALAFLLCGRTPLAQAQQELLGTYKGEYWEPSSYHGSNIQTATLRILGAQNGKITGKYELEKFDCRGTYDFEGTYQDGKLTIRTSEGAVRGCTQQIALTTNGNKLTGNTSGEAKNRPGIELSKQ